jgi:hypothetical protein
MGLGLCGLHREGGGYAIRQIEEYALHGKLGLAHILGKAVDIFRDAESLKGFPVILDGLRLKGVGSKLQGDARLIGRDDLHTLAQCYDIPCIVPNLFKSFLTVRDAVPIRIRVEGIGAQFILFQVGEPIAVRVESGIVKVRIQAVGDLPGIGHAVPVPVHADGTMKGVGAGDVDVF